MSVKGTDVWERGGAWYAKQLVNLSEGRCLCNPLTGRQSNSETTTLGATSQHRERQELGRFFDRSTRRAATAGSHTTTAVGGCPPLANRTTLFTRLPATGWAQSLASKTLSKTAARRVSLSLFSSQLARTCLSTWSFVWTAFDEPWSGFLIMC